MGSLLIYSDSFNNLVETNINKQVSNFIDSFNTAIYYGDKVFQEQLLQNFEFKFGNFFTDFVYGNYPEIIKNQIFSDLKQTIHQELQQIFFKIPGGGKVVKNSQQFIKLNQNTHFGFIGVFEIKYQCNTYLKVHDIQSWIDWNSHFYSVNNSQINWNDNDFLPNNNVSNYLISKEITKNLSILEEKDTLKTAKKFCDDFNKNGFNRGEMISKAEIIGDKIAKSNFYIYQAELSKNESKRTNSKRKIYKITKNNRDIYLSIDFHKCFCFEVCNHSGIHICELRFDGILNGKNTQDTSGKHNIELK